MTIGAAALRKQHTKIGMQVLISWQWFKSLAYRHDKSLASTFATSFAS